MKIFMKFAAAAGLIALAACGGQGDDTLGDQAEQAADNRADAIDAVADNVTSEVQQEALQDKADAIRDAGSAREEAIDNSDINADALTNAQKNAIINQ